MSRLAVHLAFASIVASSCGASAEPPPRPASIQLRNPSSTVTEGELVVAAEPDAVYAVLVDYARWPEVFTYLDKVSIKAQRGERAELVTHSKKGNDTTLRFDNDRAKRLVRFDQLGGRASAKAEIAVLPGKVAGTTLIQVRLHAEVTGLAGMFVSDATVRSKREKKVVKDLAQLETYFRADHTATSAR